MQNPTLVVLTDRNDLDDQLFGQFQRCADILGKTPVQAASRDKLQERVAGRFMTVEAMSERGREAKPGDWETRFARRLGDYETMRLGDGFHSPFQDCEG